MQKLKAKPMQKPMDILRAWFPQGVFPKCPLTTQALPALLRSLPALLRTACWVLFCAVVLSALARGPFAAPPVKAHSLKRANPNPAAFSQNEMTRKAAAEFAREDARLNVVYKTVLGDLDAVGRRKLVRAQRAWLAFRDAQASLDADEMRGGSAEPMLYSGAQAAMTRERIKVLKGFLGSR